MNKKKTRLLVENWRNLINENIEYQKPYYNSENFSLEKLNSIEELINSFIDQHIDKSNVNESKNNTLNILSEIKFSSSIKQMGRELLAFALAGGIIMGPLITKGTLDYFNNKNNPEIVHVQSVINKNIDDCKIFQDYIKGLSDRIKTKMQVNEYEEIQTEIRIMLAKSNIFQNILDNGGLDNFSPEEIENIIDTEYNAHFKDNQDQEVISAKKMLSNYLKALKKIRNSGKK